MEEETPAVDEAAAEAEAEAKAKADAEAEAKAKQEAKKKEMEELKKKMAEAGPWRQTLTRMRLTLKPSQSVGEACARGSTRGQKPWV